MTAPQPNYLQNDLDLKDLFAMFKRDIFLSLNCHHIGKIESFNSLNQTASVVISYKKNIFVKGNGQQYESKFVDYPVLLDCPIVVLGGGEASLTFPINKGDECLVLFNDRDIDNWFDGSDSSPNKTGRFHSIADGIAIVGIRSLGNIIDSYSGTYAEFRYGSSNKFVAGASEVSANYGSTKVKLAAKITIENQLDNLFTVLSDLNTSITNLITQTAAITVTPASLAVPTPIPNNAPAISAIAAEITAIQTRLGTLLE